MNDRIYELAEQAAEFTDANEFAAIERRIWDSIFRNKFAELIVRECAGLLEKEAESGHDEGTDTYNLLLKESKWMKRYFGVEE